MQSYKIIGGDGREYGPITLDELKLWIREGRISKSTLVAHVDSGNWLPASQYPEIEPDLRQLYTAVSLGFRRTGFWARLGAFVLDGIVLSILFYLVWPLAVRIFGIVEPVMSVATTPEEMMKLIDEMLPYLGRQAALYYPMQFLYDVLLNGKYGATLGKMAIGAKIVRMDGSPIGYRIAILRWFGARVSEFICYIGYLFIAFREDKRALHDLIAGTQVIYRQS